MVSSNTNQSQDIFPGEVFAQTADFDSGIRALLPRYDEMLDAVVRCLPSRPQHLLELGCGTGELSLKVLQRYPNVRITAVDYSPRMIHFAEQKRVQAGLDESNLQFLEADFGDWAEGQKFPALEGPFDACLSSLAIHHLNDQLKLKLFQRIAHSLQPGGCFWNADPILPPTPQLAEVYQTVRETWAAEQGTILAAIRDRMGTSSTHGHSSHDHLATLPAHLEMLTQAGFSAVEVPWKYYGLAVFGGYMAMDGTVRTAEGGKARNG